MRRRRAPVPGLRMADGSGGTTVSRGHKSEREHEGEKLLSVVRERERALVVARLTLIRKQEVLQTDASPFILPHPTRFRCLLGTPHLL
jgi:hypothetical protein